MLIVATVFFLFRQMPWTREQTHYLYTAINIIFKGGFAIDMILFSSIIHPAKNIVKWFGSISYALYLVHGYFLFIAERRLICNFYISSLVVFVISVAIATGLNEIIKRLKKRKE